MDQAIIIVGAGLLQVPAIQIAKEMGLKVIATDRNPQAPGFAYADFPVILDIRDVSGHIETAKEYSRKLSIAAVFTEGADVEVTVAATARALGLPGVSPEAAYACNNKVRMREIFQEHGIPGPRFREVRDLAEAEEAVRAIGLPVMIKAVDNCGSRGAKKVERREELPRALENAKCFSSTGTALLEEYLRGPEQSVETLVYRGVHYHLNIVDRPFGFDPYPIELGHINPTDLPFPVQDQMFDLVERGAKALGIDFGAAKGDMMLTDRGPIILEMTARLSGGFDCQYTSPLAHGVNYIKAAIDIALGKELDLDNITPKFYRTAVSLSPFPPPGHIVGIYGVEEARRIRGVRHIIFRMSEGDVIPPYTSCVDRVCFVIAVGETRQEAWESAQRALEVIRIDTEPIPESRDRDAASR